MQRIHETEASYTPQDGPWAVIDIQAELHHWERQHAHGVFLAPGTPFRHYVPTLKFAYDAYLLSHGCALDQLTASLMERYEQSVPRAQRLDWPQAREVIAGVWQRLRAPMHDRQLMLAAPREALQERAIVLAAMRGFMLQARK